MQNTDKPKKFSRSRSETIRTIVAVAQLIVGLITLVVVLSGRGMLNW